MRHLRRPLSTWARCGARMPVEPIFTGPTCEHCEAAADAAQATFGSHNRNVTPGGDFLWSQPAEGAPEDAFSWCRPWGIRPTI